MTKSFTQFCDNAINSEYSAFRKLLILMIFTLIRDEAIIFEDQIL